MANPDGLADRVRVILAASRGDEAAVPLAAEALWAVFQGPGGEPALITRAGGTYTKLATSVPRPPYPQGKFAPLTDVRIELAGGLAGASTGQASGFPPPSFAPRLGPAKSFRFIQAPDWWKSEPIFLVDHSRVSRRDVVQGLLKGAEASDSHLGELLLKAGWTGMTASPYGELTRIVPLRAACLAAVRQMAHELSNSPELRKLANVGKA